MRDMIDLVRLIMLATAAILVYRQRQQIAEALANFRGPRPPNPPLPGNESATIRQ